MKINRGNFYIYFFTVIIPVSILGLYYFFDILKEDDIKRKENALWVASIYQKNWDQLTSETKASLQVLSLFANDHFNSPAHIQPLLKQVNQNDPRYGGLYLLDKNGNLLTSTVSQSLTTHFSTREYIREVIRTKDTIVSDQTVLKKNKQRTISYATPVLDHNNNLNAILVAEIRIDSFKNIMKILTPDAALYLKSIGGKTILELNVTSKDRQEAKWVTLPMDHLPWEIKVKVEERDNKDIAKSFSQKILIILILTHILFLLIEFKQLKIRSENERKQNELQKLEIVGTLAASTAHEIRNPLTGVQGLVQLLSERYTDREDQYYFDVINTELKRINQIAGEFLILGKPTAQMTSNVDLSETLNELMPLIISDGNSHNIVCKWEIPDKPIVVKCVKDQIKQVIINLAKNAFESFEVYGTLEIRLQVYKDHCKLVIIDNGKGIPKDALEKLFRPFYTSKDTGSGLGLVICKRIIQSFGGTIHIDSIEFVGTTVEVTLPLAKDE